MDKITAEYHRLLKAAESTRSLDAALVLAERIAAGNGGDVKQKWVSLIDNNQASNTPARTAQIKRVRRVEWALGGLASLMQQKQLPVSQYSLLSDVLLVIFHQAFFSMENTDRTKLLAVFSKFAESIPPSPDRFHILGLIKGEEGDSKQASDFFRAALAATHADDHEFMTRLQMAWTVLVESGNITDAHELLLDTYPRVLREDIAEITSLLKETFQLNSDKPRQLVSQ